MTKDIHSFRKLSIDTTPSSSNNDYRLKEFVHLINSNLLTSASLIKDKSSMMSLSNFESLDLSTRYFPLNYSESIVLQSELTKITPPPPPPSVVTTTPSINRINNSPPSLNTPIALSNLDGNNDEKKDESNISTTVVLKGVEQVSNSNATPLKASLPIPSPSILQQDNKFQMLLLLLKLRNLNESDKLAIKEITKFTLQGTLDGSLKYKKNGSLINHG